MATYDKDGFRAPRSYCVWVLESAVLHATRNEIAWWEIWDVHTTRTGAVSQRDKMFANKKMARIRKYVPA